MAQACVSLSRSSIKPVREAGKSLCVLMAKVCQIQGDAIRYRPAVLPAPYRALANI